MMLKCTLPARPEGEVACMPLWFLRSLAWPRQHVLAVTPGRKAQKFISGMKRLQCGQRCDSFGKRRQSKSEEARERKPYPLPPKSTQNGNGSTQEKRRARQFSSGTLGKSKQKSIAPIPPSWGFMPVGLRDILNKFANADWELSEALCKECPRAP